MCGCYTICIQQCYCREIGKRATETMDGDKENVVQETDNAVDG